MVAEYHINSLLKISNILIKGCVIHMQLTIQIAAKNLTLVLLPLTIRRF